MNEKRRIHYTCDFSTKYEELIPLSLSLSEVHALFLSFNVAEVKTMKTKMSSMNESSGFI